MFVNSGVHYFLQSCAIYYLLTYNREVWHYQEADAILFRRTIHEFSWKRALSNLSVDRQVTVFNRTILNVLKNVIPHETIVRDDKRIK